MFQYFSFLILISYFLLVLNCPFAKIDDFERQLASCLFFVYRQYCMIRFKAVYLRTGALSTPNWYNYTSERF